MRLFISVFTICFLLLSSAAQASMTSTNFEIRSDSINSGGNDTSTSTNFSLVDTIGEQATGYSTSTNYTLSAGYRQSNDFISTLSFSLGIQENSTQVAYSAFDSSGLNVTVVSSVGYATGSYIGVVENLGLNQLIAVGKIAAINGTVLSVDKWDGSPGSLSAIPAGGDDFVYQTDGRSGAFGQLIIEIGKTFIAQTDVSTNAANGYTLKIQSDGRLRTNNGTYFTDVTDGEVTTGSEEYGFRSFGTTASSTGSDLAVSSTQRTIQASTTTADNDRIGMIYKISIAPYTPAGNYSQVIRYLLTANF
ncbi:MAG: hypothetical protein PHS79_05990 [Patescibacteria group bacterium]|nr:hypothetical protein [Patescibacteria group bacterium]